MKHALFLLIGAVGLTLFSCSLDLRPRVRVRLSVPPAKLARPNGIESFNTYLVMFRGNVANSLTSAQLGNRSLTCLGWTGHAVTADFATIQSGLDVALSQGSYDIRFYGVRGTGTTLTELFAHGTPGVYPLSEVVTVDTAVATSKSIVATYSGATTDTIPGCPPSDNNLNIIAAYSGPAGQAFAGNIMYETPVSFPPRDINGSLKANFSQLFGTVFVSPTSPTTGDHAAIDYLLEYVPGPQIINFEVSMVGEHGVATLDFGNCVTPVASPGNNFYMAVYSNYQSVWQDLIVTPTATGATAVRTSLYKPYLPYNNKYVVSVRSRSYSGAPSCAYLKINAISFRAVPVG